MTHNRLGLESSPYLLQHKGNPVHWWPWGPEALAEAKRARKPILLSVGYSACHWCHVMAHESFEDAATAAVMNPLFVNIKVDREERPDIDAIYMSALHALGERGGWPLTMFLTADAMPFWGGTYFPKEPQFGRPSFVHVLREIARIHREEPQRVLGNATSLHRQLTARPDPAKPDAAIDISTIPDLARGLTKSVDPVHGGLQGAPKFPQFSIFEFLWKAGIRFDLPEAREAVLVTLRNICQGGIYDHIGGGFARYSVDERWLIPHFEKMLYDNALLMQLLTEAYKETGEPLFEARIEETALFLFGRMSTSEGLFASSWDADSEGEEGRFYVWTPDDVASVLGEEDAKLFCQVYDITPEGNFEHGFSNPNRLGSPAALDDATEARLAAMRESLRAARDEREPPGKDDKSLADWNGLAIVALAEAGAAFGKQPWITVACITFESAFLWLMEDGRLWHSYRDGKRRGPGTAADYANMIAAGLALHQVTGKDIYLQQTLGLLETLEAHHRIEGRGGYATSADDTSDVIVRLETAADDATPNANATMAANLVKLAAITGDQKHFARAKELIRAFLPDIANAPIGHAGMLSAAIDLHAPLQVAIIKGGEADLGGAARGMSLPGAVIGSGDESAMGMFEGKTGKDGAATAYVCVGGSCAPPVTTAEALRSELRRARTIA